MSFDDKSGCNWCKKNVRMRYRFCKKMNEKGNDVKDTCPFAFMSADKAREYLSLKFPKKKREGKDDESTCN